MGLKYFGFIAERSTGSFVTMILREDGVIWAAFESRSYKKIQDVARKFVPEAEQENFLWCDRTWDSEGFQKARANYDRNNPIPFHGKIYENDRT